MDDGVEALFLEHGVDRRVIGYIQLVERRTGSGDGLDTIDDLGRAVVEIVGDHDLVAGVDHFYGGMAADISGAAGE